jgi:MEDS: MEthanogen/methylotroph, DcmR Sensory domain/Response regulator receiver domain
LQRLAAAGIDTTATRRSGQFELRTNTEAYLRDGRFDPDRMLEVFEQMASGTANGGFPLSRIVCHMDWAAEGRAHIDNLEFESRVNDVWCRHDDVVICVYDLAMPIIFITGYGDVPSTVRAMKAGAVEFLTKPFVNETLLSAIGLALERSQTVLNREAEMAALRDRYSALSRREREVMALVVCGRLK